MTSAFGVTPSGGSSARSADDTTSTATAVVIASCDSDDADWNTATGISAAAASAHPPRGERRIANATIATYTASSTMRPATSMPAHAGSQLARDEERGRLRQVRHR